MPVRSVTGVASMILSNATLSFPSEIESSSDSIGCGVTREVFTGGGFTSMFGFENGLIVKPADGSRPSLPRRPSLKTYLVDLY